METPVVESREEERRELRGQRDPGLEAVGQESEERGQRLRLIGRDELGVTLTHGRQQHSQRHVCGELLPGNISTSNEAVPGISSPMGILGFDSVFGFDWVLTSQFRVGLVSSRF